MKLNNWKFKYQESFYPAVVPGCIHTDLLRNHLIPDPFWASNEDSVQWVAEKDWVYLTSFDANEINDYDNAELIFEGLDTYTEIFLNGKPLVNLENSNCTNNMFREWRFTLPKSLKKKNNILEIRFLSSKKIEEEKASLLSYQLPENRAFSRKAPYESGWDWGPKLITCGIWQPVYIKLWNDFTITESHIIQKNLSDKKASLAIEMTIFSDKTDNVDFISTLNGKIYKKEILHLKKGENLFTHEIIVDNPKLWYPNGMGESILYDITYSISDGLNIDKKHKRWGFRSVELVQKPDSIGKSFQFIINGKPLFIKGANWIPAHSFISELSGEKGIPRYSQLLKDCQESHFNMLRIWGGGIYENEAFYNLCDELGIMVWQDFVFACALYPGDKHFIENVKKEAEYQVKRLSNHPALVIWCGNNEVKNGWEDWGWQNAYNQKDKNKINGDMHRLFDSILPTIVKKYDNRPYHASSPLWGWGHPESNTEGDSHYWGVWWGEEPFEVWKAKTGRFMSEYGFQSYPEIATIKQFADSTDFTLSSPALKNHQKHGRGVEIISKAIFNYYLKKNADLTTAEDLNLPDFVYLSQLTQAYGIGKAIETHRCKQPHCAGTLYWQLNDCWQVASWSSIDYYGNWKALQYEVKRVFAPLIVSAEFAENRQTLYVVSDSLHDIAGKLIYAIIRFDGQIKSRDTLPFVAKANTSSFIQKKLPASSKQLAKDFFLKLSFVDEQGNVLAEKCLFFGKPLDFEGKAAMKMQIRKNGKEYIITLSTDNYAHGIQLTPLPYVKGKFSDNFFDMEPHSQKEIRFSPSENKADLQFELNYWNKDNL